MALTGKNNEEKIWNYLYDKIKNAFGVAGMEGNLFAESGLLPCNMQDSFEKKLGMTDASYTAAVDNGNYKKFERDGVGYGIAQWTFWSRKNALLAYAKKTGKSIGDLEMQLEFLYKELSENYKSVLTALKTAKSVKAASDIVLLQFERPANCSDSVKNLRASYGQTIYNRYAGTKTAPAAKTGVTAAQAEVYVKKLLKHYPFTYCPTLASYTSNKTPHKGDIVLFYRKATFAHTGIVTSASGNSYSTIEGNTSGASGVVANGGGVCKKSYSVSDNPGTRFFRPDYSILVQAGIFKSTDAAIDAVIAVAQGEVGYLEKVSASDLYSKTGNAGSANYTKYWADLYPRWQGQPWCAIFVTWILFQAITGNACTSGSGGSAQNPQPAAKKEVNCSGYATSGPDKNVAGTYTVTAKSGLNMRHSAGNGTIMVTLPYKHQVECYGYYSTVSGVKWPMVRTTYNGTTYTGFMSSAYLKK